MPAYQHVKVPAGGQKITVNKDYSLAVPDQPIIPYIEGDGTGVDITPVMIKVVDAAVAKAYGGKLRIDTTAALEPGTDPAEFRALLERGRAECAYYVGHEPHLTAVMLDLTGMHADGNLALKKGGCYGVERKRKDEPARLRWMLAPEVLE